MKIQCQKCKEIVPIGVFRSSEEGIHVTCSACQESFFVASGPPEDAPTESDGPKVAPKPAAKAAPTSAAAASARPKAEARSASQVTCPKCGAAQPEARACRTCGLSSELWEGYEPPELEHDASPKLSALWDACQESWDDSDVHAAFAEQASTEGAYLYAVRLYRRAVLDRAGSGDGSEVAKRQLERLARMSEVALLPGTASLEHAGPEPYKNVLILLIALLVIGGALGMYALIRTNASGDDGPPQPIDTRVPATHRR